MPIHRFTVAEYHQLAEDGIFAEDDRVELLDGEIILMAQEGFRHGKAVRRLSKTFHLASKDCYEVGVHDPLVIGEHRPVGVSRRENHSLNDRRMT